MKKAGHNAQSTADEKKRQWLFPISMVAAYMGIYFFAPGRTVKALMASGTVLKQMVLPLLLAFFIDFNRPQHVGRIVHIGGGTLHLPTAEQIAKTWQSKLEPVEKIVKPPLSRLKN